MPRKRITHKELAWGPVVVTSGRHKGRIGYYDDDNYNLERECEEGIVYFGHGIIAGTYSVIPLEQLAEVTTQSLMKRKEALTTAVSPYSESPLKGSKRAQALEELHYIDGLLADRMFAARAREAAKGVGIFISHSSKDKEFARWLAVDLRNCGYRVWFDEWNIKVGDSIPREIGIGLERCDYVVVILSSHAVESRWVENEWHAKYWDEIEHGRVRVLPVLIEECAIPTLLKTKKYADFRHDHGHGSQELLDALTQFAEQKSPSGRTRDASEI